MTKPRSHISASLATRGRPEMWANEQEAATLSGMALDQFALRLLKLEQAGFPRKNLWNGKRFIPHIVAFWDRALPMELPTEESAVQDDVCGNEHWENDRPPQPSVRRAS